MSDLIDRQAAIDALEREKTYCTAYKDGYTQTDYFKQYNMGLIDGIKALNNLPSVEPEATEEAVKEYCRKRCLCIVDSALLKKYVSAQPERKKGKWIDEGIYAEGWGDHAYYCSVCGEHYIGWVGQFNFCPNCGSDNREVE